jgi:hypothetical protein
LFDREVLKGNTMNITRTSLFTGKTRTIYFPTVTEEKLKEWQNGGLIQNVFPELSADEREFLMTGIIDGEWEENFNEAGE